MTVLKDILLNNISQTCAIIQDDNTAKGTDLFKAVLRHDMENDAVKEIHLITCENPPKLYLGNVNNSKIHIYNLFQDPNCWLNKNETSFNVLVHKVLSCREVSSSVMIDSLSFLILFKNEDCVCNIIYNLKKKFNKVTCLLHRDEIICNGTMKKLIFLSNCYLKLSANSSKLSSNLNDDKKRKLVEGIHVQPNGKMARFNEIISVDEDFQVHSEIYQDIKQNTVNCTIKDDFKNITTFRLGLDIMENEKIARNNLVLPYLRSAKGDSKTGSGEGRNVYYAESGDDLDEDCDDDLDI